MAGIVTPQLSAAAAPAPPDRPGSGTTPDGAPAVSVCIRAHRDPVHLQAAIASVLRQSFGDFEIVVSDDSGGLGEVARSFGDSRIRYSPNPCPAGPAANLRRAIGLSGGRMIAVLNEDDEWLPTFLATAVAALADDLTLGVAFSQTLLEVGGRRMRSPAPFAPGRHTRFLTAVLEHGVPCSANLMRRAVWDDGERRLPIADGMLGDVAVWLRAAAAGWAFHSIDEPLAVIRLHRYQVSWQESYATRFMATLEAFQFEDVDGERLRRARLAELLMVSARIHLRHRRVAMAASAIARAHRTDPRRLGIRDLLALTGLRELTVRAGLCHPRLLFSALAVWQRIRPPVSA